MVSSTCSLPGVGKNFLKLRSVSWHKPENYLNKTPDIVFMSQKGPEVGIGMLDFVEDFLVGVKSH